MSWHTSILQHIVNKDLNNKNIISKNQKKYMALLHHIPPLSGMARKCEALLMKWIAPLNSWNEILSNDYKLGPFLTPSKSRPSGISRLPQIFLPGDG